MMEDYARSLYEVADYRDRVVTIEDDEYDDYDPQTDDLLQIQDEFFIEPSTGAQLSRNGAIGLLYQYCATLPGDAYSNHIPDFKAEHAGIGYVCTITMPLNAPISLIRGEIQPSKKKAKQDAAFRACIDLRRKEALTDRFFPYRVKMTHDERGRRANGKQQKVLSRISVPQPRILGSRLLHSIGVVRHGYLDRDTGSHVPRSPSSPTLSPHTQGNA
jgi:hypothetical protein